MKSASAAMIAILDGGTDFLMADGWKFALRDGTTLYYTNPNRFNVLFPAQYVNQLRIFALLNEFRLTNPPAAVTS